jgi:hypothetical protein
MTRSSSAEKLTLKAFDVHPAQVKVTLCIGGNRGMEITVSERTSTEDLRKIVSIHFGGRCRVQPD